MQRSDPSFGPVTPWVEPWRQSMPVKNHQEAGNRRSQDVAVVQGGELVHHRGNAIDVEDGLERSALKVEPLNADAVGPDEHFAMEGEDARQLRHFEESMLARDPIPAGHAVVAGKADALGRQ